MNQNCPDIAVSNTIEIALNSNFTFVNTPVNAPNLAYLKKVLVHEFGHGFMARHTVNRSIMYPNDFFENISSLTTDDHLCGVHTFKLGNTGPACNPTNSQPEMDLNIGSFDCQTTSRKKGLYARQNFSLFPNPSNEYLSIEFENNEVFKELEIRIINTLGGIKYVTSNVNEKMNINHLAPGLYYVQLVQNNISLGIEKLIIHD